MSLRKRRLSTIDIIRGITMISMILYHFCWDLKYIKGLDMPWYGTYGTHLWQQSICWSFILISGFCMNLARKPIINGVIALLCGLIITCVTEIFLPQAPVYFGVLTMLGSAMVLIGILMHISKKRRGPKVYVYGGKNAPKDAASSEAGDDKESTQRLEKGLIDYIESDDDDAEEIERFQKKEAIDPFWGFFLSALVFSITKRINYGVIGIGPFIVNLPDKLYGTGVHNGMNNMYLTYLGFMQEGFYSSDYFSLIPWIFLFVAGYFLYGLLRPYFGKRIFNIDIKPLSWLGRHSLIIYLLHQPVLYAITLLI